MNKLILSVIFIIIFDVLFCSNTQVKSFPTKRKTRSNLIESVESKPNKLNSTLLNSKTQHIKKVKSDNSNTADLDKNKYDIKYNRSSGKNNEEEYTRSYHEKGSKGYDNYEEFHNKDGAEYAEKGTQIKNNKYNDKSPKGIEGTNANKLSNKMDSENLEELTESKFPQKQISNRRPNNHKRFESNNSKMKKNKDNENESYPKNKNKHKFLRLFDEDEENTGSLEHNNGGYESFIIHVDNSNEEFDSSEEENPKNKYSESSSVVKYYPMIMETIKKGKGQNYDETKPFKLNNQIKNLKKKIGETVKNKIPLKDTEDTEDESSSEEENISLEGNSASGKVKGLIKKEKDQKIDGRSKMKLFTSDRKIKNLKKSTAKIKNATNMTQDSIIEQLPENELSAEIVEEPKKIPNQATDNSPNKIRIVVESIEYEQEEEKNEGHDERDERDEDDSTENINNIEQKGKKLEETTNLMPQQTNKNKEEVNISNEEPEEALDEPEGAENEELDEEDDSNENMNNIKQNEKETEKTINLVPEQTNKNNVELHNYSDEDDGANKEDNQTDEIEYDEDNVVSEFIGEDINNDDDEEDDEIQIQKEIINNNINDSENLSDECEENCYSVNSESDDE